MKLYKYRSLRNNNDREHTLDIIKNKRLFMASFHDMNDPLEGLFNTQDITHNAIQQIINEKSQYKICCLSDSPYNMLMWTHYADNYQGCCIEIDIDDNLRHNKKGDMLRKIKYTNQGLLRKDMRKNSCYYLSRKLTPWKHEREYRILRESETETFFECRITQIFIGYKMTSQNKQTISSIITTNNNNIGLHNISKQELIDYFKDKALK